MARPFFSLLKFSIFEERGRKIHLNHWPNNSMTRDGGVLGYYPSPTLTAVLWDALTWSINRDTLAMNSQSFIPF